MNNWTQFIERALEEDVKDGDHTSLSCIPENANGSAKLLVKEEGIIAGIELAEIIFHHLDSSLKVNCILKDGTIVSKGDVAFTVEGSDRNILTAERLVLNCMQRMSGVATLTSKFVEEVKGSGVKILDTRKTTPLFRGIEKWAVKIGGGHNHRFGLFDMIMIKDNHIDYAGGIKEAIESVQKYLREKKLKLKIEIETRSIDEVKQVISIGEVDRIMLDNFQPEDILEAVKLIKGKFEIEVSGGISLETINKYALPGVNFISVGSLTNGYRSLDMSLKAVK